MKISVFINFQWTDLQWACNFTKNGHKRTCFVSNYSTLNGDCVKIRRLRISKPQFSGSITVRKNDYKIKRKLFTIS